MKKTGVMVLVACALVAGCGDDDNPTGPSANAPLVFTAQLSAANEVPPVANSESTARGAAQITFDVTRNASNAITAATARFYFQVTGLSGTIIVGAHIHPGAAGVNGPVVVSTGLSATSPLALSADAVEFTVGGIAVDPALAQAIIDNPAGYYFNLHSPTNPGGVARGQLTRTR
jgi:hypothetical protein